MKELQRQGNPNIVIALAGNKVDLASKRTVEIEVSITLVFDGNNIIVTAFHSDHIITQSTNSNTITH